VAGELLLWVPVLASLVLVLVLVLALALALALVVPGLASLASELAVAGLVSLLSAVAIPVRHRMGVAGAGAADLCCSKHKRTCGLRI
jgi:hypothetical protein